MKKALLAIAVTLAVPLLAGAGPMKAGKWQMTIQTEMPNMPMKIPPVVVTNCITKEQAENPQPPKQPNSDCTVGDYKIDGNTVTWTMSCPKQKITGSGKITYSADSYTGGMKMKMGEQEMSATYAGKRLGDCDK